MIYVIDASVAVKWFVREEQHQHAVALLDSTEILIAPDLIAVELASVFVRKLAGAQLDMPQAQRALASLQTSLDRIEQTADHLPAAMTLAARIGHSLYDCVYLACAVACDGRVVTEDRQFLARATRAGYADRMQRLLDWPLPAQES